MQFPQQILSFYWQLRERNVI